MNLDAWPAVLFADCCDLHEVVDRYCSTLCITCINGQFFLFVQRKPRTARSRWKRLDLWRNQKTSCTWRLNRTRSPCPAQGRLLITPSPLTLERRNALTTSWRFHDRNSRRSACLVRFLYGRLVILLLLIILSLLFWDSEQKKLSWLNRCSVTQVMYVTLPVAESIISRWIVWQRLRFNFWHWRFINSFTYLLT